MHAYKYKHVLAIYNILYLLQGGEYTIRTATVSKERSKYNFSYVIIHDVL